MRKTCALIALVSAFASTQAAAGPGYRWDGLYVGANIGGTWGHAGTDVSCTDGVAPGFCATLAPLGFPPTNYSSETTGALAGGQVGYNFQNGNWVFGVETDFAWTDADGDDHGPNFGTFGPETSSASTELDWFGTLRGRLGWASGDLLVYATGGLAYAKVESAYAYDTGPGVFFASGSSSETQTGWTLGAGAEIAFGQWSLRGEYLYYNLGDQDLQAPFILVAPPPFATFQSETEIDGQIARVGLNYHLN